ALAAKVFGDLGSPAELPSMPLVLIVDDFDFADARSRDFVRELVRSQRAAYGHAQDRALTLVLNTEDADRTEVFLGLRGVASRPERVVTGGTTAEDQKAHLQKVAQRCVLGAEAAPVSAETQSLLRLLEVCQSPFEVEVVLRYLYRQGKVTKSE